MRLSTTAQNALYLQEIDPNVGFSHLPDDVFDEPGKFLLE